jgi:hypothetical protein
MILVFFFVFLTTILLAKFRIIISSLNNKGNEYSFVLKLFTITIYKFKILIKFKLKKLDICVFRLRRNKPNKLILSLSKNRKKKDKNNRSFVYLVNAAKLDKFSLDVEIGADDACKTAIYCGYANIIYGMIYSYFKQRNLILEKELKINPNYNFQVFNMSLICIISFNLANIIIESIKIKIKKYRRR